MVITRSRNVIDPSVPTAERMVGGVDCVPTIESLRIVSFVEATTWNTLDKERLSAVDIRRKHDYNAISEFPR